MVIYSCKRQKNTVDPKDASSFFGGQRLHHAWHRSAQSQVDFATRRSCEVLPPLAGSSSSSFRAVTNGYFLKNDVKLWLH